MWERYFSPEQVREFEMALARAASQQSPLFPNTGSRAGEVLDQEPTNQLPRDYRVQFGEEEWRGPKAKKGI